MTITADDIVGAIKPRLRNEAQETRIRQIYQRCHTGSQAGGKQGIKQAIEADWGGLKSRFATALTKVKKDTGLF